MASTYPNPASIKTPPVGTTSVQIAPQNLSRSGLYVFNLSASIIWVCPGLSTDQSPLAASVTGGSTAILPSSGLVFQEFTGAMNAIAVSGSGNQVTVWEFYHGGPTSVISAGGASGGGGGGGGGVPEAPLDGLLYGRQSATWNQSVPEAPLDGNIYGRDNAAWVQLTPAVNAAPFDALAYNGMQINGNGDVSQELGSTGVNIIANAGVARPCDGWLAQAVQAVGAVFIGVAQQPLPAGLPGFQNCVRLLAGNSNFTAATNGDGIYLRQAIEGYRVARLGWGAANALSLTYAMNLWPLVSGTIFVRLFNSASNRIYYQEHVVTGGVWNWLTATIPGDLTGTWLKDNNIGLNIDITVGGKDAAPAAPGIWSAGSVKMQTTNSTNLMGTSGNFVSITGFIVLPGIEVPTAARSPLIMRPFDQELATCQRYYETTNSSSRFTAAAGGPIMDVPVFWRFQKRAAPTAVISTAGTRTNATSVAVINPTVYGAVHQIQAVAGGDVSSFGDVITADARL